MPQDGSHDVKQNGQPGGHVPEGKRRGDWFRTPEAIARIFRKFPLATYPSNALPANSPGQRNQHALWLWTTAEGAQKGSLSFNPTCLKWQAYLTFCGITFRTEASNNHASPSGSLPFLLPAALPDSDQPRPIPSSKLRTWAKEAGSSEMRDQDPPLRADAYSALIDHRIRRAWLYTLYLEPSNFEAVARRLYVSPSSSNPLVDAAISYQLRKAAQEELVKMDPHASAERLLDEAREAFAALSTLLKEDDWFFAEKTPGLFDANLFAYTHLLLDEGMGWVRNEMADVLRSHPNLIEHRERVLREYFS